MNITLYGEPGTPEYSGAQHIAEILQPHVAHIDGEISVRSGIKLFGQRRRDVDILIMGRCTAGIPAELWDASLPKSKSHASERKPGAFFSFVLCIEVKDQCASDVRFENTCAWVRYREKWSDASNQNEQQKYSLLRYFKNFLGWQPFVCNLLWFRNIEENSLPEFPNNILPAVFTVDDLLSKAAAQMTPFVDDGLQCFHSTKQVRAQDLLVEEVRLFSIFDQYKASMGNLTRARLEKITRLRLLANQAYSQAIGNRLVQIKGRAGTGKTIKLLHIAFDLCVRRGERVLILTYNRLLVSDIRRMITLAGIDSALDRSTIEIETIHSYIFYVLRAFAFEASGSDYLQRYSEWKRLLLDYLEARLITADDIAQQRRDGANEFCWDKVLIDEGQDWPDDERRILFALFESRNVIVACGTGQMVRSNSHADWTNGVDFHKPIIYEKKSLRQKKNLCEFQRAYTDEFGIAWDLEPSDELLGGSVIVNVGGTNADLLRRLEAKCKEDGNQAYDFLFLCPPSLTTAVGDGRRFALREQFESCGIKVWDGIPRDNRTEFPTDVGEHRVVTYESARGLEGWIVNCLDLDSFCDYKSLNPYLLPDYESLQMRIGFSDHKDEVDRIVHEWVLISFTRAIDTLVITLRDGDHAFSRRLLSLASRFDDFVEVIFTPVGIS
jgi:hypothetical protein